MAWGLLLVCPHRNTVSKPVPIKYTVSSEEIVKTAQIERKHDVATLSKFEILPELPAIDKLKF